MSAAAGLTRTVIAGVLVAGVLWTAAASRAADPPAKGLTRLSVTQQAQPFPGARDVATKSPYGSLAGAWSHAVERAATLPPRPSLVRFTALGPLEFGRPGKIRILLAHQESDAKAVAAYLQAHRDALAVRSVEAQARADGRVEFTFGVVPRMVGRAIPVSVLMWGSAGKAVGLGSIDVTMPPFYREGGSNFVEIMEAPDASIYGAHISVWRAPNQKQAAASSSQKPLASEILVTGHAASSVCRRASAALFYYALRAGAVNDDFFMGAGLARIPRDPDLDAQAAKISASLRQYPNVYDAVVYAGSRSGNSNVHNLLRAASDDRLLKAAQAIPVPERERYTKDRDRVQRLKRGAKLDEPGLEFMQSLVQNPYRILTLEQAAALTQLQPALDELARLDPQTRTQVLEQTRILLAYRESVAELEQTFNSLDRETGLLKTLSARNASAEGVRSEVQRFAGIPMPQGSLALGQRDAQGVALLPYYLKESAVEVSFLVPQSAFRSDAARDARDLFRSSVQAEMQQDVRRAAERFSKLALDERSSLERETWNARKAKSQLKAWLDELVEYNIYTTDETGNYIPTGRVESWPRYQGLLGRIATITEDETRAAYFRDWADQLGRRQSDAKLQAVQDLTLLDAFLRRWDLAFADDSMASPYRRWIEQKRDSVWALLIEQARAKGVDVRDLITESTVFQVRPEGDNYRIRPLFVADVSRARAVKAPQQALVWYEHPWDSRQFSYLRSDTARDDRCAAQWQAAQSDPRTGLRELALCYLDDQRASDPQQAARDVATALRIEPDFTANLLIERLWASWKDDWPTAADQAELGALSYDKVSKVGTVSYTQLSTGTWPFADDYLIAALEIDRGLKSLEAESAELRARLETITQIEEAAPQRRRIEDELLALDAHLLSQRAFRTKLVALGRAIDAKYMDEGLALGERSYWSGKLSDLWAYASVRAFQGFLGTADCLAIARSKLEHDGASESAMQQDVAACATQLGALEQSGYVKALGLEGKLAETNAAITLFLDAPHAFDRVGRDIAGRTLDRIIGDFVVPAYLKAQAMYSTGRITRKALLDALVRLYWHAGQYSTALKYAVDEVAARSDTEETRRIVHLIRGRQSEIMHAIVYSGGQLHRSVFGRKASDWVVRPESADRIPVAVTAAAGGADGGGRVTGPPRFTTGFPEAGGSHIGGGGGGADQSSGGLGSPRLSPRQVALSEDDRARVNEQRASSGERVGYLKQSVGGRTGGLIYAGSADPVVLEVAQGAQVYYSTDAPSAARLVDTMSALGARSLEGSAAPAGLTETVVVRSGNHVDVMTPEQRLTFVLPGAGEGDVLASLPGFKRLDMGSEVPYVGVDNGGRLTLLASLRSEDVNAWVASQPAGETIALLGPQGAAASRTLSAHPEVARKNLRLLQSVDQDRAARNLSVIASSKPARSREVLYESEIADLAWDGEGWMVVRVDDWARFEREIDRALAMGLLKDKQIVILPVGDVRARLSSVRERALQQGAILFLEPSTVLDRWTADWILNEANFGLERSRTGATILDFVEETVRRGLATEPMLPRDLHFDGHTRREPELLDRLAPAA